MRTFSVNDAEPYVVICDNPEDKPNVYGPFATLELAKKFIDSDEPTKCPNEHIVQVMYRVEVS